MALSLGQEDITRLKNLIELGVKTKFEVKDLNDSLRETVNEVAKELNLPKKLLNDAIRIAAKAEEKGSVDTAIDESQEELDLVQELLEAAGRK